MDLKEKYEKYILENKDKYSVESINSALKNEGVSDEIINDCWNKINNKKDNNKKKYLLLIIPILICLIGGIFLFLPNNNKTNDTNSIEIKEIEKLEIKFNSLNKFNSNISLKITGYENNLNRISNENELTINLYITNHENKEIKNLKVRVNETNLNIYENQYVNLTPNEKKIIKFNFIYPGDLDSVNIYALAQNEIGNSITHKIIYLNKNARPICYEDDNSDQYVYGSGEYKSSEDKYRDSLIEDKCGITGSDPIKLNEAYCENGEPKTKEIICENGCRNGECIR